MATIEDQLLAQRIAKAVLAESVSNIPHDENKDGRSSCAKAIKYAHKHPSRRGGDSPFQAADDNNMLKTNDERREERAHLSHAESAATGGRGAGDVLRKSGTKMTALDAIKGDIATAKLRDLLQQAVTVVSRRVRKNAADDIVTQGSRRATVTSPRLPPQSRNGVWQDPVERAPDGADTAHDAQEGERQRAGIREQATPFRGPGAVPHDSSIYYNGTRLPEGQEDGTDNYQHDTVDAIKRALQPENARPYGPGALGSSDKDPNRFDSF